jgi:hypothetical protein
VRVMTRRAFVHRGLGLAAATVPFAHAEAAAALAWRVTGGGAALTRSRFTPLVRANFRMTDGATGFAARLIHVRDVAPGHRPGDENCFSLLFQTSAPAARVQSVYRFSAPNRAVLPLLAVPVGQSGGYYEVVVNNPA